MRYPSIRSHLKPYAMVARRRTTIHHAFAAAIAPNDIYEEQRVRDAMTLLGQHPDEELTCVYCGDPAQTWDHVRATVIAGEFSGHGHRLGNLLPCCKACNSAKGNGEWRQFLATRQLPESRRQEAAQRIGIYLEQYYVHDAIPEELPEYQRLRQIRQQVLALMAEADTLARCVREQATLSHNHAPTGSSFIASLFEPEPESWGLRGDPYLWRDMAIHMAERGAPINAPAFQLQLQSAYECLVGCSLTKDAPIFLTQHDHGGISSGQVCPEFWRLRAIPLLLARFIERHQAA